MKEFFENLRTFYTVAMLQYEQWLDERSNLRALNHILYKAKTEWIFSGTVRNENGVIQDGGYLRSPGKMNRAKALKYFRREFPRAVIVHVDEKNKIITYSF